MVRNQVCIILIVVVAIVDNTVSPFVPELVFAVHSLLLILFCAYLDLLGLNLSH